jgi:hypothetical protein
LGRTNCHYQLNGICFSLPCYGCPTSLPVNQNGQQTKFRRRRTPGNGAHKTYTMLPCDRRADLKGRRRSNLGTTRPRDKRVDRYRSVAPCRTRAVRYACVCAGRSQKQSPVIQSVRSWVGCPLILVGRQSRNYGAPYVHGCTLMRSFHTYRFIPVAMPIHHFFFNNIRIPQCISMYRSVNF